MTRPAPHRKITWRMQEQWQREYKALCERVDASPEMAVYRNRNRLASLRSNVRGKVRGIVAGTGCAPWTSYQLAALRSDELARIKEHSAARWLSLTDEQRSRLKRYFYLLMTTLSDTELKAVADYEPSQPKEPT